MYHPVSAFFLAIKLYRPILMHRAFSNWRGVNSLISCKLCHICQWNQCTHTLHIPFRCTKYIFGWKMGILTICGNIQTGGIQTKILSPLAGSFNSRRRVQIARRNRSLDRLTVKIPKQILQTARMFSSGAKQY